MFGAELHTTCKIADLKTRIELIKYNGKQVLFVDCSNCSAREVEDIARKIPDHVTICDRRSVLLLSDFTKTCFDRDTIRTMQETAVFNKSYIRKSAWVGTASFLTDVKRELEAFSRRRISLFESRDEALNWLTSE